MPWFRCLKALVGHFVSLLVTRLGANSTLNSKREVQVGPEKSKNILFAGGVYGLILLLTGMA